VGECIVNEIGGNFVNIVPLISACAVHLTFEIGVVLSQGLSQVRSSQFIYRATNVDQSALQRDEHSNDQM